MHAFNFTKQKRQRSLQIENKKQNIIEDINEAQHKNYISTKIIYDTTLEFKRG